MNNMEIMVKIKYTSNKKNNFRTNGFKIIVNERYEQEIVELKSKRNWLWMHAKVQGRGQNQALNLPKNSSKVQQQYADLAFYCYDMEKYILGLKLKSSSELKIKQQEYNSLVLFISDVFKKYSIPDDEWDLLEAYTL